MNLSMQQCPIDNIRINVAVRVAPMDFGTIDSAYLSAIEWDRLASLKQADDRKRFITARVLIKQLAADINQQTVASVVIDQHCPNCAGHHGRPRLRGSSLQISISHSGHWVAVAACEEYAVGIDIERLKKVERDDNMANFILHSREHTMMKGQTSDVDSQNLLKTWVRKEALLKAYGTGLLLEPNHIALSTDQGMTVVTEWIDFPGQLSSIGLVDVEVAEDYHCCVAVLGQPGSEPLVHLQEQVAVDV